MRKRYSFTILLLLGLFALSMYAPTFAKKDEKAQPVKPPKFTVKVSDHTHTLGVDRYPDTWLYLNNPSKLMERDGSNIHHKVVINQLTMDIKYPTGEEQHILDPYDPEGWGSDRWKTEVLPGEETLVFFLGWGFNDPLDVGKWEFTYTLNVDYEGTTYDLVRTFNINVLPSPPQAQLTFWENPTVITDGDTIPAGEQLSDIVHRLQILNIDDMSDTDIVEPLFHVETEDMELTWVDWEQYATWSEYYAEWDFQGVIFTEELGTTGPCFGVDRQETINLDFEMNRQADQPVITASGTYTASFTLEFTYIYCEWVNGYIVVDYHWCLDASIVQGSLTSTNAPIIDSGENWYEGRIREVWFFLDLDLLETGVVYDFSVLIDVDVTDTDALPILYKPSFGINYLVSTEWRDPVEGDTVEIPPDMRPDYVTAAWVSTDESNMWTLGRRNEINACMHEVVVEQFLP